jgi:hypothetical protein
MFDNFSKINYKLSGKTLEFTDIFKSIKVNTENSTDINTKTISGTRPDQFSNLIYNDPKLFWVTLLLNNIKNPFTEWSGSVAAKTQQNEQNYDTKIFQFANTSQYLSGNTLNFNENELDSYSGIDLSNIQQDDIILFQTGSGSFELKTYGAGEIPANTSCGYPHFGQAAIPDNFLNRNNIIQISCGKNITACLDDLGYIWAWGEDIGLEASGFSLNGRLYRSATGQYKFIDTTKDKIVAINYSGDLQCFGNCGNFTYTGQTNLVKTAWTSGNTLAGLAIKSDNTLQVFGPIVSTDSTAQYFSVVSCADDYCLGVITGPNSNNKVVGFGSTGYFNQITQAVSYSNTINDLGTIPSTNPLYPFVNQNNKILKQYNRGILELKLKDLPPFTSPAGNGPEEAYRSDYYNVYSSGVSEKILIGTTDIDSESREGFFINNPKLFAGPGINLKESLEFDYKPYYDENLKPSKHYGLFDNINYNNTGITSIENITINYGVFTNYDATKPIYKKTTVYAFPYFKSVDKKSNIINNSFFSGPYYYENSNVLQNTTGISLINSSISYPLDFSASDSLQNYTIKTRTPGTNSGDTCLTSLDLTTNNKLKYNSKRYTQLIIEAVPNPYYTGDYKEGLYFYNSSGGFTAYVGDKNFWNNFDVKHLSSRQSDGQIWTVVKDDGTPYNIRDSNLYDVYKDLADLSEVYEPIRNAWTDMNPPAGITFYKIENANLWAAGIASDYRVHIWGITYYMRDFFGQNNTKNFIVPGITAKDIQVNEDNLIIIKNSGKINFIGGYGYTADFSGPHWNMGEGFTVSNAIKIVGPDNLWNLNTGYVLTSDGKVKLLIPTPLSLNDNPYRLWTNAIGVTQGGFRLPVQTTSSLYSHLVDGLNLKNTDISNDLNDGSVSDIHGNSPNLLIIKNNGEKILTFDNPVNVYANLWAQHIINSIETFYNFGKKMNKPLCRGFFTGSLLLGNTFDNQLLAQPDVAAFPSGAPIDYKVIVSTDSIDRISDSPLYGQDDNLKRGMMFNYLTDININPFHGMKKTFFNPLNDSNWNVNCFISGDLQFNFGIFFAGISFDYNDSTINSHGVIIPFDNNHPKIICKLPLDYGLAQPVSDKIDYTLLLDGCAILTHPNKKITILEGDKSPFNNTPDLTNLTTFNTLSFDTQEQFDLWEQSLVTTLAIGDDIFCGYNPEYVEETNKLKQWGNLLNRGSVPSTDSYKQVDCFASVCCGIKQDGLVECWGQDVFDVTQIPTSVGVCDLVAVGKDHACAQNRFGNVICWGGYNQYGQCDVPASVNDGTGNKYLDCGDGFSVVCKNDNRIIAWGLGVTGPDTIFQLSGSSIPTVLDLAS